MSAEFWAILGVGALTIYALGAIERVLIRKLDEIRAELAFQNEERRRAELRGRN